VWILTVAADGAVPLAYRLADGNTSDDPTTSRRGTHWSRCWAEATRNWHAVGYVVR
jgi:hypothetical protein